MAIKKRKAKSAIRRRRPMRELAASPKRRRRVTRKKGLSELAENFDVMKPGTAGNIIASGLVGAASSYVIKQLFPTMDVNKRLTIQAFGSVVFAAAGMPVVGSGLAAATFAEYINRPSGGTTMAENGDFVDPSMLTGGLPLILPMAEDDDTMSDAYTLADSYTLADAYTLAEDEMSDAYTLAEGYSLSEYIIQPNYQPTY